MTFLGIIGNFAFSGHLPEVIDGFLNSLGDAFSASALFLLGVNMVCNNCNKNQVHLKTEHFNPWLIMIVSWVVNFQSA